MKKLFLIILAALWTITFASCTPDDEEPLGGWDKISDTAVVVPGETEPEETEDTEDGVVPIPATEPIVTEAPQTGYICDDGIIVFPEKPVIYLYPTEETVVTVKLNFNGTVTHTYPTYRDGWTVTGKPDGTLADASGREYYCLFWEGVQNTEYEMTKGFVVAGEDTASFLETALSKLGLTDKEANEFIIYWAPRMENNQYNLISFQTDVYTDNAELIVDPAPDTVIRVFMAWQKLEEPVSIEPQVLAAPERIGFTVVEWGGAEIK